MHGEWLDAWMVNASIRTEDIFITILQKKQTNNTKTTKQMKTKPNTPKKKKKSPNRKPKQAKQKIAN